MYKSHELYPLYENVLTITNSLEKQLNSPYTEDYIKNFDKFVVFETLKSNYIYKNICHLNEVKILLDNIRINDRKLKLLTIQSNENMNTSEGERRKTYLEEIQYVKTQVEKVENSCKVSPIENVPRREHRNSRKTIISNMKYLDQWEQCLNKQKQQHMSLEELFENDFSNVKMRPAIQNKTKKRKKHISSTVDLFLDGTDDQLIPLSPVKEDENVSVRSSAIFKKQTYQDQKNRISDELAIFNAPTRQKPLNNKNVKPKIVAYMQHVNGTFLIKPKEAVNEKYLRKQEYSIKVSNDLKFFYNATLYQKKCVTKPKIVGYILKDGIFTTKSEADMVLS